MLDAQRIEQMDGPAKLAALLELVERTMPGATNGAIADAIGIQRRTYQQWKQTPNQIPAMALMLLEAWAERTDAEGPMRALQAVAEAMEQLAGRLGDLAREMKP